MVSAGEDWLALPAKEPELPDYLRTDALDAPSVKIEVQRADAALKDIRFEVMKGSSRVWACNGRYVACRPSDFKNPRIAERHNQFLRTGHYRHVGTFDDVQLFELTEASPWYRTPGDARAGTWYEVLRAAAQAAVARDFGAYVDLLEEIASRLKSAAARSEVEQDMARDRFNDTMEYLEQLIFMRWSADKDMRKLEDHGLMMNTMRAELDAGVHDIRARRGSPRSSVIATRARPMVIR